VNEAFSVFENQIRSCIACKSMHIRPWLIKRKFGICFSIFRCSSCGTGFMNPRPKRSYLKHIYEKSGHGLTKKISLKEILQLEKEYPNSTVDALRMVNKAMKFLDGQTGKALDIGSGFGFYSRELLRAGFEVVALDPGRWENSVYKEMNSFMPIESYIEEIELRDKYEVIILSQVLEHIIDVELVLNKLKELLSDIGVLVVAVPNVNSIWVKLWRARDNSCLCVPEHLQYFSKKGIYNILERSGFKVLFFQPVSRIPYYAISNRLNLKGFGRKLCNSVLEKSQKLPFYLLNGLGYHMYHNLWCMKKS